MPTSTMQPAVQSTLSATRVQTPFGGYLFVACLAPSRTSALARAPPRIVEVRHGPKKERMRPISSWAVSVGGYAGLSVREHDVAGDEVGHDARNVPSGAHRVSAAPIELQQARGQVCRSAPVEAQLDVSSKLVAADDTSSSWRPMQSCTYAGAATSETIAIARAATAWASTS